MNVSDARQGVERGTPWLSIIVLGYNRFNDTSRRCLDSLDVPSLEPDVEVILIDNGSADDSAALSEHYCCEHSRIRFVPSAVNLGFAGGMNAGVALAQGDYVLLANSDLVFPAGAIAALRRIIGAQGKVDVLGPVTNAAGNAQALPNLGSSESSVLAAAMPLQAEPTGQVHPMYRADFFCVVVKRSVWQALGGLDTGFGRGYYEDFDFSLRAQAAGYQLVFTEDVVVYHAGSVSFAKIGAEQREWLRRNKQRLQRLHPSVRFPHQREENLDMLKQYSALLEGGQWNTGLERRLALRVAQALENMPRNPLKRFLWRRKVQTVLARLRSLHAARTARVGA